MAKIRFANTEILGNVKSMKVIFMLFLFILNCLTNRLESKDSNTIKIIIETLSKILVLNTIQLNQKQAAEERIRISFAELESFSSDKSCSADNVCKTVGVGDYQYCSGPASHIIFSKEKVDEEIFQKKIDVHNALTREYANKYMVDVTTTCAIVSPPTVLCINSKCENASGLMKNLYRLSSDNSYRKCSNVSTCKSKTFIDNSCASKSGYIVYSAESLDESIVNQEIGYRKNSSQRE